MANFRVFLQGFFIFFIAVLIGFILSYAYGRIIDAMIPAADGAGMLEDYVTNNGNTWSNEESIATFINIGYALCYAIPITGALIAIINTIRTQQYDQIMEQNYDLYMR